MTEVDEKEALRIREEIIACTDGLILVEGPAGCGKSTLAIDIARRQLTNKDGSILVCGHLNSTRVRMSQQLQALGIGTDNTFVTTVDALILDLVKRHIGILGVSIDSLHGLDKEVCCIDFPQVEGYAERLCEMHPSIGKSYGRKFPLIIVDEFQDLNLAQYKFVRMLSGNSQLIGFGDGNQTIIGFDRGSNNDWDVIEQAKTDGATYFNLPHIPGCNRFVSSVLGQLELELRSHSGNAVPLNPAITLKQFHDASRPDILARDIAYSCANRSGKTTAIIVETRSTLTRLKQELKVSRPPIYCRQVIPKDQISKAYNGIEAIGRLLFDAGSDMVKAHMLLLAWAFQQRVADGRPFRKCIEDFCTSHPIETETVTRPYTIQEITQFIEDRLGGVSSSLAEKYEKQHWSIDSAKSLVERQLKHLRNMGEHKIGELTQWRRWVSGQHSASLTCSYDSDYEQSGRVLLLTIHQAKNRQFDNAVVILEPHFRTVPNDEAYAKLYVACSRARSKLTVFKPSTDSQMWGLAKPYFANYIGELENSIKKRKSKKSIKKAVRK